MTWLLGPRTVENTAALTKNRARLMGQTVSINLLGQWWAKIQQLSLNAGLLAALWGLLWFARLWPTKNVFMLLGWRLLVVFGGGVVFGVGGFCTPSTTSWGAEWLFAPKVCGTGWSREPGGCMG